MNLEQRMEFETKEARHLRTIISIGLVLVLAGIVAAYIYFGMQFAKVAAPVDVPVEDINTDLSGLEAIEAALQNAPVATPEEMAEIEAALENAPVAETADLEAIQQALGQPTE
jgi:hypothetical protein